MAGQLTRDTTKLPAYQVERRQRILDAAKTLLRSTDFESIQIRDVASTANVALGTVYRYFSSKEHLYATVLYDWSVPFYSADQSWASGLETTGRVAQRLRKALTAFEKKPHFYQTILILRTSSIRTSASLCSSLCWYSRNRFAATFPHCRRTRPRILPPWSGPS